MSEFKVIVAGCGGMSTAWIKELLDRNDANIVGLMDIYKENAIKRAEEFNLKCDIFTDLKQAIKSTGANLVLDVSIPESHRNVAVTAIENGCHVFGEKPMASSMEEALEMLSEAEKHNKSYTVMQNRRYDKNIRSLRELIEKDVIGEIGFVCADFFLGPHFGGFRDAMDSPLLLDMAIHTFDQARFITGADPVAVYCHEFNSQGSWYKGNASAVCIFEMSNGAVFCYRGSWCATGVPTSWQATWRITGSKGTAIWDGDNAPYAEVVDVEEGFTYKCKRVEGTYTWNGRTGHGGCLDEMFKALKERRNAETDCKDNIKSLKMVFSALKSSKNSARIVL